MTYATLYIEGVTGSHSMYGMTVPYNSTQLLRLFFIYRSENRSKLISTTSKQ